jgi:hypothetical protein
MLLDESLDRGVFKGEHIREIVHLEHDEVRYLGS